MKYTRLEISKGISNSKLKVLLGFFILIPVIAVAAGSIIIRIFIPNAKAVNFNQYEGNTITVSSQNKTIDYKIYFLQAGAFISKNNADVLKNAITSDDINPIIIEDNNIYRVIAKMSDNKELITQIKDKLQTLGYNCLLNEFSFACIKENDNGEIEKTNNLIETSINIIKLQMKLSNNFSELDINNSEILKKYIKDLNEEYLELEKINTSSELKNYKNNFEQYANDYIKGYTDRVIYTCQQDTAAQVLLLNNFYKEAVKLIIK